MEAKKVTIIFIDDETNRMSAHVEFLRESGCDVIYASEFYEAIDLFKKFRNVIDLVILDIMMPLEDTILTEGENEVADDGTGAGLVIFDRISKIKRVPTIILTVLNNIQSQIEERKIEKYLIKPLAPAKLLMSIKEVLQIS